MKPNISILIPWIPSLLIVGFPLCYTVDVTMVAFHPQPKNYMNFRGNLGSKILLKFIQRIWLSKNSKKRTSTLRNDLHAPCGSVKRNSSSNYGSNSFKQSFLNTLSILCLWFRASLIILQVHSTCFEVLTTPIIRITSLQCGQGSTKIWPVTEAVVTVLCNPDDGCGWRPKHVEWTCLGTLEGGNCTKNMTSTVGCSYSFVYSW
jgi:hypothetical protein